MAVKSQIYKLERFIRYIAYFLAANGGILKSTYNRYEDGRILKIIRPNFDNFKLEIMGVTIYFASVLFGHVKKSQMSIDCFIQFAH